MLIRAAGIFSSNKNVKHFIVEDSKISKNKNSHLDGIPIKADI